MEVFKRSRPRFAAAQRHAPGPAHDGTHANFHGFEGRCAAVRFRLILPRWSTQLLRSGSVQLVVEHQPWIKEIDINSIDRFGTNWPARSRRPSRPARPRHERSRPAPSGHPPLPLAIRGAVDIEERKERRHSPDPPRGRAVAGEVSSKRSPPKRCITGISTRCNYPNASRTSGCCGFVSTTTTAKSQRWWLNTNRAASSDAEILGVGRLSKLRGVHEAEFALVISDALAQPGPWRITK